MLATAREPAQAADLAVLARANPGIAVETLDVTSVASMQALAAKYRRRPIDVLFNNAARLGDRHDAGNRGQPEQGLSRRCHAS